MNYNFSEDLKAIREILGVTQSELSEQLNVEQATVSRNESGRFSGADSALRDDKR